MKSHLNGLSFCRLVVASLVHMVASLVHMDHSIYKVRYEYEVVVLLPSVKCVCVCETLLLHIFRYFLCFVGHVVSLLNFTQSCFHYIV